MNLKVLAASPSPLDMFRIFAPISTSKEAFLIKPLWLIVAPNSKREEKEKQSKRLSSGTGEEKLSLHPYIF
ncbi:hypothetical protein [Nafulsella turpanensis]|uniref:hypothetical protein n=1 Tax=Nafulsella turpanensis TaxID=1265690 RepID=UPI000347447C|nr:hypothetical protein [Nafulsella turpanensis]